MGRGKKFLHQVKTIFGSKSPRTERPLENAVSADVLIASAPGQPRKVEIHTSRPSIGEGNSRDIQTTRVGKITGSGENIVAQTTTRSDGERIMGHVENTAGDNRLGVPDVVVSEPSFKRDIRGINPSTNESRNCRTLVGGDEDGELFVPLGRPPPIGHSPSESMGFHNINNSAISMGTGPVNVSNNNSFSGATFVHSNPPSQWIRPGLDLLQKHVATSAFHNSSQRIDPPRCHPDTRVAIQKQINAWILLELLTRQTWIMWMHGAAGAGKSAIMQSIAEFCEEAQIPLASFFFFRTDPTRNSIALFIATLVYQLIQTIPRVRDEILTIIEGNPLIFKESLESQLRKLVIQPLLRVRDHFKGFFVVFIDGLDECIERAHQSELIKLLGSVSRSRTIPVIFVVASRREPQIEAAFVRKEISDLVQTLPLDNSDVEQTSDDIRRFLNDKCQDIKETHLLKRHIPVDWPAASMVDEIVDKSSGQFIFASVVINYLSSPRANPVHQLEVIRGIRLRDSSSQNPFEHLDALYRHIFSQVEILEKVFDIIAFVLSSGATDINHIERAFLLEAGEIDVLFADLTAIILLEPHTKKDPELKFLHASLPDFLLDNNRSEKYHIDCEEYRTKLLCMFLERSLPKFDPLGSVDGLHHAIQQERSRLTIIYWLLPKAKASEPLQSAFMKFNSTFYSDVFLHDYWYNVGAQIIERMTRLDFGDEGKAYHHVVNVFAPEYTKYWPLLDNSQKAMVKSTSPALGIKIDQILQQPI